MKKNNLIITLSSFALIFSLPSEEIGKTLHNALDKLDQALTGEKKEPSVVEETEGISDYEARIMLVKVLLYNKKHLEEAKHHLSYLYEKKDDPRYLLLKAKYEVMSRHYKEAGLLIKKLYTMTPSDDQNKIDLGHLESYMGRGTKARAIFTHVLSIQKDNTDLLLEYADVMPLWGDYLKSAEIYQSFLKKHPESPSMLMDVAKEMVYSQRYFEAEQLYLEIFLNAEKLKFVPHKLEVLERLAALYIEEKKFTEANQVIEYLENHQYKKSATFQMRGDIDFFQARYQNAAVEYIEASQAEKDHYDKIHLLIRAVQSYEMGQDAEGYEKALTLIEENEPHSLYVKFFRAEDKEEFLDELLALDMPAQDLFEWAQIYRDEVEDYVDSAILILETTLERDPDFFQAKLDLARTLAYQFDYEASAEIYEDLKCEFPDSSQILLERARLWSWSKWYDYAIDLYTNLIGIYPEYVQPKIERARVATWAQEGERSYWFYETILTSSVDCEIQEENFVMDEEGIWDGPNPVYGNLIRDYSFPEAILLDHPPEEVFKLLPFWAKYENQKYAYLEQGGNYALWNKEYYRALAFFQKLIEFTPGNEEAIFTQGQVYGILGMMDKGFSRYDEIHTMDKSHSIVNFALHRREVLLAPAAVLRYNFWTEQGRGGLSGIARHKLLSGVWYKPNLQTDAALLQGVELDYTFIKKRFFVQQLIGFEFLKVLDEHASLGCSFFTKPRTNTHFKHRNTGTLAFNYKVNDFLNCGLGYERGDVFTNYFGVKRSIQTDNYWTSFAMLLSRRLSLTGRYNYYAYTDRNYEHMGVFQFNYQLSEYPKLARVTYESEFRNTHKLDIFIYNKKNQIVNIIRPYWCPQHYYAGRLYLEYQDDLSWFSFIGAPKNWYLVKWAAFSDTESNPGSSLLLTWHCDFSDQLTWELTGYFERSAQWDAQALWSQLLYRF